MPARVRYILMWHISSFKNFSIFFKKLLLSKNLPSAAAVKVADPLLFLFCVVPEVPMDLDSMFRKNTSAVTVLVNSPLDN